MDHEQMCNITITTRKAIRSQLQRFCELHKKTQAKVLEDLISTYCQVPAVLQADHPTPTPRPITSKLDFIAHLHFCFEADGGALKKEAGFFRNNRYLVHLLYRKLGPNESKVINAASGNVMNLLSEAKRFAITPLIAFFALLPDGEPIWGVVDPRCVPSPVPGTPGRKLPVFLRENSALYFHLRNEQDRDVILQLSRQSLPDELFTRIFGGN